MSADDSTVQYRDIPGCEGFCKDYRVGDDGSFWARWRPVPPEQRRPGERWASDTSWRRFTPKPQKSGHIRITFPGRRRVLLHHLVLEAFVGPRPPGMECRHLDGNPGNNRVTNLKWDTHTENMRDKKRHGTGIEGSKHKLAKLTEAAVRAARTHYATGNVTVQQLADTHGVSLSAMWFAIKRKTWAHVA